MHKKLADELMSLAHSILQMKRPDDLSELLAKTNLLQEKLSLLALIERYDQLPQKEQPKEELIEVYSDYLNRELEDLKNEHHLDINPIEPEQIKEEIQNNTELKKEFEESIENKEALESLEPEEKGKPEKQKPIHSEPDLFSALGVEQEDYLEQEFVVKEDSTKPQIEASFQTDIQTDNQDDVVVFELDAQLNQEGDLGSDAEESSTSELNVQSMDSNKTINEKLFQKQLNIGLNDRIAFVKHLFDGDQQDFNRVISQINTLGEIDEALDLIKNHVRPEYDWSQSEEVEARFMDLIERKFN